MNFGNQSAKPIGFTVSKAGEGESSSLSSMQRHILAKLFKEGLSDRQLAYQLETSVGVIELVRKELHLSRNIQKVCIGGRWYEVEANCYNTKPSKEKPKPKPKEKPKDYIEIKPRAFKARPLKECDDPLVAAKRAYYRIASQRFKLRKKIEQGYVMTEEDAAYWRQVELKRAQEREQLGELPPIIPVAPVAPVAPVDPVTLLERKRAKQREANKRYYWAHKAEINKQAKANRALKKEYYQKAHREYYQKHREEILAKQKEKYQAKSNQETE